MTADEEKFAREVLQFFYPDHEVPKTISEDLAELATKMMQEALEGSKAIRWRFIETDSSQQVIRQEEKHLQLRWTFRSPAD